MAQSSRKIVVVGGGIIGASIAYHLASAGAAPIVLDDGPSRGEKATAKSWAWINASWGNPRGYFDLRMRSIGEWHRLGRELPGLPLSFCGSLTYDMPEPDLHEYCRRHGDWGYRIRLTEAAEIARLAPALKNRPALAAFCEDEGRVEPAEAAEILLAAAIERGASLRIAHADRLVAAGGRVVAVEADGESLAADEVVVAGGIGTPALLATAGIDFPLDQPPGLLAQSQVFPPLLDRLIVSPLLELRQTAHGRLLAAFDFAGHVPPGLENPAQAIIDRVNAMLELPELARLERSTTGIRPVPKDGFPAIGRVGGVAGLYLTVMHSGVTLAAAVGAFAADELLHGRRDPLLDAYSPDRFLAGAPA